MKGQHQSALVETRINKRKGGEQSKWNCNINTDLGGQGWSHSRSGWEERLEPGFIDRYSSLAVKYDISPSLKTKLKKI